MNHNHNKQEESFWYETFVVVNSGQAVLYARCAQYAPSGTWHFDKNYPKKKRQRR